MHYVHCEKPGSTWQTSRASPAFTGLSASSDRTLKSRNCRCPCEPFSKKSTRYLAQIALNRSADVESYGVDRYGRVLGEVFVDGNNVNLEMVKAGLAEVYRGNPAQGQDVGPYWKAEETAKKAGPGMWVLGIKYVSPRDWRKTHQN